MCYDNTTVLIKYSLHLCRWWDLCCFFFSPEEDILMFTIMNMELLTVDFETSGGILSMQFILLQNLS